MTRAFVNITLIGLIFRFILPGPQFVGLLSNVYCFVFAALGGVAGFSIVKYIHPSNSKLPLTERKKFFGSIAALTVVFSGLIIAHNVLFLTFAGEFSAKKYIFFASLFLTSCVFYMISDFLNLVRKS